MTNFLVEIHTEELPPKALLKLAESFREGIKKGLADAELTFSDAEFFATPRRLAVKVNQLMEKQADNIVERRGPAWVAAFDDKGKPTQACLGFAKSCGVSVEELMTLENPQGKWVGFKQKVAGKTVQELLPNIVQNALNALPIPKRMRWGNNSVEFVRPVHSVILLYGSKVIDAEILGCRSGNITAGHRFLCKKPLKISNADDYADILEKKGFVIADFEKRKNKIIEQVNSLIEKDERVDINDDLDLLEEVTSLVEWPVALLGKFDSDFLKVPQEILISAMKSHQRYFPLTNIRRELVAKFIVICNIESNNTQQVIDGNERVLRARLSDAAFFYQMDNKIKLIDRVDKLSTVVYQEKLGTLLNKVNRLAHLSGYIARKLGFSSKEITFAEEAGKLSKADLTTELVGEFPELQGVVGYYYAQNNVDEVVARAIRDQYLTKVAEEPSEPVTRALALADRLDHLVGFFGMGLIPTGEKDPFALRRAAIMLINFLKFGPNLDLYDSLQRAVELYDDQKLVLTNKNVVPEIWNFILDRIRSLYRSQGISAGVVSSVLVLDRRSIFDIDSRIKAVNKFKELPQAEALSIANKRVSNILSKYEKPIELKSVDSNLFEHESERVLANELSKQADAIAALAQKSEYEKILTHLAELRDPVDQFFDHVLVMAEDQKLRENRLLLLKKLRELFLQVADIALLQQ